MEINFKSNSIYKEKFEQVFSNFMLIKKNLSMSCISRVLKNEFLIVNGDLPAEISQNQFFKLNLVHLLCFQPY